MEKQGAPWFFSIRGRVVSSYPDLLLFEPFGATVAAGCGRWTVQKCFRTLIENILTVLLQQFVFQETRGYFSMYSDDKKNNVIFSEESA